MFLLHMHEALEDLQDDAARGEDEFMEDRSLQRSVIRSFEVLGEAAKNVSAETGDRYPDVPWKRIAGFRDVLIHAYFRIEPREVWRVIEHEVEELQAQVARILGANS